MTIFRFSDKPPDVEPPFSREWSDTSLATRRLLVRLSCDCIGPDGTAWGRDVGDTSADPCPCCAGLDDCATHPPDRDPVTVEPLGRHPPRHPVG